MLKADTKLPDFRLQNQAGQFVSAEDFRGRWLVLYVYPKDDTPGCTVQGKSFTATKADFDAANAVVLGLSADDVASHKGFCDKFGFKIDLLADPEEKLLTSLGIGQSEWKGVSYRDRTTFLVDPKGTVRKVYEKVNPQGHEQEVLKDLKSFAGAKV